MRQLSTTQKLILISFFFFISILGFMLKLPAVFRGIDQELHFLFYFILAFVINYLFQIKSVAKHLIINVVLFFFGVGIEIAQHISNFFFKVRVHGNFDPADVYSNFKGIFVFSVIWFIYFFSTKKSR